MVQLFSKELMAQRKKHDLSVETRQKLADLARKNKPRKGRGLVAPVSTRDGVDGKVCVRCQEWKPLPRFSRHKTSAGGRTNICSTCEGRRAYKNSRESVIRNTRKWQAAHPEQCREIKRAGERKRHGRKMEGRGVTVAEYRNVKKSNGGACVYCLDDADTVDHVIPLSRGGKHEPENLVPACRRCNFQKHNKLPSEWLGRTE